MGLKKGAPDAGTFSLACTCPDVLKTSTPADDPDWLLVLRRVREVPY